MLASLMGSSILSEVHETPSILGTKLFSASAILDYRSLGSCSRAAGWSAATLCGGSKRTCRGRLTMSAPQGKTDVPRGRAVRDFTRGNMINAHDASHFGFVSGRDGRYRRLRLSR